MPKVSWFCSNYGATYSYVDPFFNMRAMRTLIRRTTLSLRCIGFRHIMYNTKTAQCGTPDKVFRETGRHTQGAIKYSSLKQLLFGLYMYMYYIQNMISW